MWKSEIRKPAPHTRPQRPPANLAETLKTLRQEKGWTLTTAASACSISASTLSRIENAALSPTYDMITKICDGFGISIRKLLSYDTQQHLNGWRTLTRKGSGRILETPQYRLELLCDDILDKPYLVFRAEILARSLEEFDTLHSHAGQEQIVVQSGRVEVWIDHYTPTILQPGDSLAFDSALDHALVSVGEETAVVLWICDSQEP